LATVPQGPLLLSSALFFPKTDCALTNLRVGEIPIQEGETLAVALTLIQVFPRIISIEYGNPRWKSVVDTITLFHRISGRICGESKVRAYIPRIPTDILPGNAFE
jgi:hypothetical protein